MRKKKQIIVNRYRMKKFPWKMYLSRGETQVEVTSVPEFVVHQMGRSADYGFKWTLRAKDERSFKSWIDRFAAQGIQIVGPKS